MSAEFSTFGANSVLDGTGIPATLYLKAHLGNPGAAGTANAAAETTRKAFTRSAASAGATSTHDQAATFERITRPPLTRESGV